MTLNNLMVMFPCNAGDLGDAEYPFIAIATRSTLVRSYLWVKKNLTALLN